MPPPTQDPEGAGAPLRQARLRDPPGGRGDPHAPRLLPGAGDGQAARVYIAGLHRARRQGIAGDWAWIGDIAGQRLFRPPNVSGWNELRWLDTSTFRGRWIAANEIAGVDAVDPEAPYPEDESAKLAVKRATKFWGNPGLSKPTRQGPRALRRRRAGRRDRGLAAEHLPRPAPERPADADRHLPRPAELLRAI